MAGFQSLSKWSLFWQDQVAANMNGISQSGVQSYATEWRGEKISLELTPAIWCASSVQALVMLLPEMSQRLMQCRPRSCMPLCTCHCPLYFITRHITAQYRDVLHSTHWWRTLLPRPRGQDSSSSVDRQSVAVRSLKMRGGEMLKLCYNCNWAVIQFEN